MKMQYNYVQTTQATVRNLIFLYFANTLNFQKGVGRWGAQGKNEINYFTLNYLLAYTTYVSTAL